MCEYCGPKEKDLARIDIEDEDDSFVYLKIMEKEMKLSGEGDHWEEDIKIDAIYCPMCGRNLKEEEK